MTAVTWDAISERKYEAGVDRGVIYLDDGRVVPWNGLTGVEDSTKMESNSFYLDGVKYLERFVPGDYIGSIKAYTYPDELNEVTGVRQVRRGLYFHGQKPKRFSLAYRTRIGNDTEGSNYGYRLHILYNVTAVPEGSSFETISDDVKLGDFSWSLSSTPPLPVGLVPTTHISIDSTVTDPDRLAAMERLLYGTDTTDPRLPPPAEFTALFSQYDTLVIVDNGDGTWTATDLTDSYITMLDAETFQIDGADATYLDADTYELSTTNAP